MHDNYQGALADGRVWAKNDIQGLHPLRGGSWGNGPVDCRAADRNRSDAGGRYYDVGFRLALPCRT